MKKLVQFILATFMALGSTALAQGVYEAWANSYNGPGNSTDYALALAVDNSGNVYVTGTSVGSGSSYDYATIKYSPSGDTLWVRRYNGPGNDYDQPSALAVDDSGNVYVTGTSIGSGTFRDYATIKYSPSGSTLWVRRYNGPGNQYDKATALAVDESGNVYVTGNSNGDCTTIKYSPSGDTLWVQTYSGPTENANDQANALAVDAGGNVYVTGGSDSSGTLTEYTTIKYSPSGNTLWVRRYNGPGNNYDEAFALAVDDTSNVYVTGTSIGSGTSYDYATVKYSPSGDTLWVRRYNGPANAGDEATALGIDNKGNVYVTGGSVGNGTYHDYATIKYSPSGDTLWVRRYNGPPNFEDVASALAVDDSGNVYVTGTSIGSGTSYDYATVKYSPSGSTLWVRRYNGLGNDYDLPHALAADGHGNTYVTGDSYDFGTSYNFSTIKYSPCSAIPGDVNGVGGITLADIIHLINFYFDKDKPPCSGSDPGNCWESNPVCQGDTDGTAGTAITDIIYLVNYYFDKDRPATSCLGSSPGNCWTPVASGACCLPVP